MASEFVAVAIWLFAAFAAGTASGIVLAQAVAIHLETRLAALPEASSRTSSSGRGD
jgi:hypothetical protein